MDGFSPLAKEFVSVVGSKKKRLRAVALPLIATDQASSVTFSDRHKSVRNYRCYSKETICYILEVLLSLFSDSIPISSIMTRPLCSIAVSFAGKLYLCHGKTIPLLILRSGLWWKNKKKILHQPISMTVLWASLILATTNDRANISLSLTVPCRHHGSDGTRTYELSSVNVEQIYSSHQEFTSSIFCDNHSRIFVSFTYPDGASWMCSFT